MLPEELRIQLVDRSNCQKPLWTGVASHEDNVPVCGRDKFGRRQLEFIDVVEMAHPICSVQTWLQVSDGGELELCAGCDAAMSALACLQWTSYVRCKILEVKPGVY